MTRFSLKALFVLVGCSAVASRMGSEVLKFRAQEQAMASLRGLGPSIVVETPLAIFL